MPQRESLMKEVSIEQGTVYARFRPEMPCRPQSQTATLPEMPTCPSIMRRITYRIPVTLFVYAGE